VSSTTHLEEGLAVGRRVDDRWSVGIGLLQRGTVALLAGEYAAARAALSESLERARAMGNRWTTGASLEWLGHTALAEGDAEEADALYVAALAAFREAGDGPGAARLLGLAAALRSSFQDVFAADPFASTTREQDAAAVRAALGDAAFAAAWAEGRGLAVEQVVGAPGRGADAR
jgi:hypothetical protein